MYTHEKASYLQENTRIYLGSLITCVVYVYMEPAYKPTTFTLSHMNVL